MDYFYPRSPCGERQTRSEGINRNIAFLSTLSLRRATLVSMLNSPHSQISIHALLAESDPKRPKHQQETSISIHALLAESDAAPMLLSQVTSLFLSTLSLRRATSCARAMVVGVLLFLSTLSLRRATLRSVLSMSNKTFLSTLSLRRATFAAHKPRWLYAFLSTLSLRRATSCPGFARPAVMYFYPRSPCGERLCSSFVGTSSRVFLSTLSLRRATTFHQGRCII